MTETTQTATAKKVDSFESVKKAMEQQEKTLGCFFSPLFKSMDEEDAEFVELIRQGYNNGGKTVKKGKEEEVLPYAVLDWNHLMPELASFKKLQDSIAEEIGSHKIFVTSTFKLGNSTFEKGKELGKDYCEKLILQLNRMIQTSGSMSANVFMTQLPVLNKFDANMDIYNRVLAQGKPVENIVENFVENYIGWNPVKNKAYFDLCRSNIVRMIKQSYSVTKESNEITDPLKFEVYDQMYYLPGAGSTGKTSFIKGTFFGSFERYIGFNSDPEYADKRASNLVFFLEEMAAFNQVKDVGKFKEEVSAAYAKKRIAYDKFPVPFLMRSIMVAATNNKQLITDTTTGGNDRRGIFIPFSWKANPTENRRRVMKFWSDKGLKYKKNTTKIDTEPYFTDFVYSILFGTQYESIPIEIEDEIDENGNTYILNLNKKYSAKMRHTTTVQQLVEEFINSQLPVVGSYDKMKASLHKNSILKIDEATDLFEKGTSEEEILSQLNNTSSYEDYSTCDDFDALVPVRSLKRIHKKDILTYLEMQKAKIKSSQELFSAFELMGYTETEFAHRSVFVRDNA